VVPAILGGSAGKQVDIGTWVICGFGVLVRVPKLVSRLGHLQRLELNIEWEGNIQNRSAPLQCFDPEEAGAGALRGAA
jgi:hypothetical protein